MIEIQKKYKKLNEYKFIDLFAGIGGFHYALKSFGAECVFASEINKKASDIYEQNHNLKPAGDITIIDEKEIPKHDILCGGFPCQAFSISGKQKGFEDTRGTLFFDIARIVNYHRPKILFLSVEPLLEDLGKINLQNIDWVIVGGESGNRARPMDKSWILNIKLQCNNNNIVFLFKQWGNLGSR